jgi:hypothetical protein
MEFECFMNRVFVFNSVLMDNFHSFRERDLAVPLMHSFLACEETSIPSRPQANEIITYSNYYLIGMNTNRYLSFQNLYDPRLNRKNILDIYTIDQRHYSYLYLFVILKKVVLRDLSERFSRLDFLHITRRTAKEYRLLESDVLNYVNTINMQNISNDPISMDLCTRIHKLNAIAESFSEIFTSIEQLNDYRDARIQKRQSEQMDLLQGIFLVGVAASVVALGAMPNAYIVTRDGGSNIIGNSQLTAFSIRDLLIYGPIAVLTGIGFYLLFKLMFLFWKKE